MLLPFSLFRIAFFEKNEKDNEKLASDNENENQKLRTITKTKTKYSRVSNSTRIL